MWIFNFVGTWFDVGLAQSQEAYWVFAGLVTLWAICVVSSLARFFPLGDARAVVLLQMLLGSVMAASLLAPPVRLLLGGTATVSLGLSIVVMAVVTARHIVMHDLRLNAVPRAFSDLLKYMAKYAVALLFIVFTNIALGFFLSGVTDVTRSPGLSRDLNADCILAGVFDAHDTWHLLSALSLSLWIMALLDMKLRMFKRCVWLAPPRAPLSRNAFSASFAHLEEVLGS